MPFLHSHRKRCPRLAADSARRTVLNGYRPFVALSSQSRYAGVWRAGKKNGFGTEMFRTGWAYEGNFLNNLRHGFGTLRKRCATTNNFERVYVGEWQNGRRHGEGKQFYKKGVYWGQWANGVRCGLGIMWLDEMFSTYIGEWKSDKYDGAGVLFQVNRNRYEGMFRAGLKHGEGTFYHLHNGQVQKGFWVDDQCITSIMQDELRHNAMRPTPYPIHRNMLDNPNCIVRNAFRHVMDFLHGLIPPTNDTASTCPYSM